MDISRTYRYTLKKDLRGHDVWALQINLNNVSFNKLTEDGDFGPVTLSAVKNYQAGHRLLVDGIAGLRTQQSLALVNANPYQTHYKTPPGLMRGIIEGESGWAVGACNWSVAGGVDLGWVQRRVYESNYTTAAFRRALDGKIQFTTLGANLRQRKEAYYGRAHVPGHKRAWELAVLYHNWPVAAENLSIRGYIYNDRARDDQRAQWVVDIGVKGVETPRQWAEYYIDSKTAYVKEWTE